MKKKIMLSFQESNANGGPYISHKRIMESSLAEKYDFSKLIIPKSKKIGVINVKLIKELKKQIKLINPDVIQIHGLQLAGFNLLIAAKIMKKKVICAIHGSSLEAKSLSPFKRFILKKLELKTLKHSDVLFGVSDYVCKFPILNKYQNKLFGTIYNLPISYDKIEEQKPILRSDLGFKEDDIIIVSSGRITAEKGYDFFASSIVKMHNEMPNVKFLILGDGEYLNTFKNIINENCLNDIVKFMGYVTNVFSYLSISDIFAICTHHETLCISILEAQILGLPVVATNVGGIPEIIDDGKNGYLFNDNDYDDFNYKICNLITQKELREKMSMEAKNKIKNKFSNEVILEKLDKLYEEIY